MTKGQISGGKPCVAISSPTDITAALAAARDGYMYDIPSERKGVEIPRLKYPAQITIFGDIIIIYYTRASNCLHVLHIEGKKSNSRILNVLNV